MYDEIKVPIGLVGRMCSGKDTVGSILVKCFDYKRVALGDKIRTLWEMYQEGKEEAAFLLLNLFSPKMADKKDEFFRLVKGVSDKRVFLQKVGTWARKIDNHIWIRQVAIKFPAEPVKIVCTDVRRKAELEYLKACGFCFIYVDAPDDVRRERYAQRDNGVDADERFNDSSEAEIAGLKQLCDTVVVNDGDKSKLSTDVLCAIQKINMKWGKKHEI